MQIRPYLTFKGKCQEAIDLYTKAFKTEVKELMRFSDLPQSPDNPMPLTESQKSWILQATIPFGDNFMRLSDCFVELNEAPTERVALCFEGTVDEVKHAFAVLAVEGNVGIPLQETFFSPCHGVVYDKFGVMWNFVALDDQQ